MVELAAALGLALVIEGAVYALFPHAMKRLAALLIAQPEGFVRLAGLATALIGLMFVVLAKGLP